MKLVRHKKVCPHVRDHARLDKIRNLGKESKIHFESDFSRKSTESDPSFHFKTFPLKKKC